MLLPASRLKLCEGPGVSEDSRTHFSAGLELHDWAECEAVPGITQRRRRGDHPEIAVRVRRHALDVRADGLHYRYAVEIDDRFARDRIAVKAAWIGTGSRLVAAKHNRKLKLGYRTGQRVELRHPREPMDRGAKPDVAFQVNGHDCDPAPLKRRGADHHRGRTDDVVANKASSSIEVDDLTGSGRDIFVDWERRDLDGARIGLDHRKARRVLRVDGASVEGDAVDRDDARRGCCKRGRPFN